MLTVSTYVAPSAIDGLGVFAGEYIERGRLMWSLNPKFDIFISREEIEGYAPHLQNFISRYSYPHLEIPGCGGRRLRQRALHESQPHARTRTSASSTKATLWSILPKATRLTCNYHEFDPTFVGYFPTVQVAAVDAARLHASGR